MSAGSLSSEIKKYPAMKERYESLQALHSQRLWHQLTVEISEFVLDPRCSQGTNLIDLYHNFIAKFEGNLNQLKFVQICSVIARQFLSSSSPKSKEVQDAIDFMNMILGKSESMKFTDEAIIVCNMAIGELCLFAPDKTYQETCLEKIKYCEKNLLYKLKGTGAEGIANSAFYRVCCEYYKLVGPSEKFYNSAVQFLAFTPQSNLSADKQQSLAIDICLAALASENVYSFGEVLPQPILQVLKGTENSWLLDFLKAFNDGDIESFSKIFKDNEANFQKFKILAQNIEILRQKMGLLCLMRIVFERVSEKRTIDLDFIAKEVKLESNMVEWMLMKAMAKGLIKGKIDGVERTVTISWLKPRVLTIDQLGMLDQKLDTWKNNVTKTHDFLVQQTPELLR